jgi:small-conductance mechanosensitive channel
VDIFRSALSNASGFLPTLATVGVVAALLALINWTLRRRWRDKPDTQFRFQLIMLALTFAGGLAVIVALPIDDGTRGQLLSLIGILLSAAIALSSTTFIGNMMAGIMLRAVGSARPGDFITVAELTGRITEMGLLHTEIQTEFRDLVTVPNLFMVTQPLQVVRSSGTIISAEVSLGYDTSHVEVSRTLLDAAKSTGLKNGFVHIRQLGDFSITYRVAGLLEEVASLISARSRLREAMLDALHESGIEIVSPNFMNTRVLTEGQVFIPEPSVKKSSPIHPHAETLAFDKAEEAASVEQIRKAIEVIDAQFAKIEGQEGGEPAGKEALVDKKSRLVEQLQLAEEQLAAGELAEKAGDGG